MKTLIAVAALASFAALAEEPPAAPAKMEMPKPPAEMSVEQWFAGTWNCKGVQHAGPMGPEHKTASRLQMTMEFGGFWLQVKGTAMAGPMKGKEMFEGFATWDGSAHQRWDFAPGGMHQLSSKGWDGDKLVFEGGGAMMGQKQTVKHTITRKSDSSWDSAFEIDGKPMMEETCTKAGAAKAPEAKAPETKAPEAKAPEAK